MTRAAKKEKFFELKRLKADEGFIRVQCRADGIFPKPVMTLHSQQRRIPEAIVQSKQEGHLYEISAQVTLPELEKPEEFSCKLHIPLANYTTRRETVFYPDLRKDTKWKDTVLLNRKGLEFSTHIFKQACFSAPISPKGINLRTFIF
ncbi:hypothetical protein D910_03387 [Dendroctonus ponderosae]|uniref:Uncharacterized protein n=1 Tax=Dendroctonus ponderosae TaxID=77166 RepID=U4U111_DENPD|nr:hypothetical protein D910_03387 [Dendroctonus ponderosae]